MKVRLGIDLGGSVIKAGIVSLSFKVLYRVEKPSRAEINKSEVKKSLNVVYDHLLGICRKRHYLPLSLGIGSPGTISQPLGKVTDASPNIKGWQGTVLTEVFGKTVFPVYADNDANCAALAEYLYGFKYRYKDIVFITVGTGIGGGLIIDGKLHRGNNYAASEIGHSILKYNGRLCKCGRRGCLEAYASVPNMLKRAYLWAKHYNQNLKPDIKPVELFSLYKRRNRVACKTIEENADFLGTSLASLVNILNPQVVVIGGGFSGAGKEYIRLIKNHIFQKAFSSSTCQLKVVKAQLGNDAGFIGASALTQVDKNGFIRKK
ncbi:MAG: hypothetical protein B6D58_08205 [candidate division Zixibacteria bacterium 4484_95]|nr:MAG: hypothetical protein B6D58_08205 [candidate division Zixibacteria bacterium 4484_95]